MPDQRAVIFDVDGVLVDSYQAHFRSWQLLATENGRSFSEAEFAAGFGRTSREIIAESWSAQPLTDERIRQLDERKEAIYRNLISDSFPEMDGSVDLLRELNRNGFAIGVGSSGPPANVQLVINKLGVEELIDAQVTGADVTRGKPDPQVFEIVSARLGVPADRCVVVEDARAGIAAARAAGMKCIGLVSTGHARNELTAADLVVDSLRELSISAFESLL